MNTLSVEQYCLSPSDCRIIGLDSWDGPTKGALYCAKCRKTFFFDLIDWDEGDDADMRVFALIPLPPESFENIFSACRLSTSTPSWPVWLPIWKFQSKDDETRAEFTINEILKQQGDYEIVGAWKGNWLQSLISARYLSPSDLPDVRHSLELPRRPKKNRDWFSFLSINRST